MVDDASSAKSSVYSPAVREALGNVVPLAVAVAIFPIPIIAAVLVVGSERGRAKGCVLVLAWAAGLAAVVGTVLVFAGAADASEDGEPATWVSLLLLALGVVVVGLAAKQWRGRPRAEEEAPAPAWMRAVGDFTLAKAAGLGFALSGLNPKNVLLSVAAAAEIAEVGLPAGQQAAVLAVFVVVASAGVLTPLVLTLVLGARAGELLDGLRRWMARHNAVIMAALFLLIGVKLVADGIAGLSG